jgi:hypothetical protein
VTLITNNWIKLHSHNFVTGIYINNLSGNTTGKITG